MDKQRKIDELAEKLAEIQKEITGLEQDMASPSWNKVRKSLNSSVCYLKQANKQIADLTPMEGQISLFDISE